MMIGNVIYPTPVKHAPVADPERVDKVRKINCRLYDRCLDEAIEKNWDGFTCHYCPVEDTKSIDELRAEAEFIRSTFVANQR